MLARNLALMRSVGKLGIPRERKLAVRRSGLNSKVLTLFSEVGRDMSRWPIRELRILAGLMPGQRHRWGRVLWKGIRRVNNRAGHLFRQAAYSLHHDPSP